jgi:hypothetical protein
MNKCWEFAFSPNTENTLESRSGKGKRGLPLRALAGAKEFAFDVKAP